MSPRTCAICERPVPADTRDPLCRLHEESSRAAGKQAADAERFPDPEATAHV